MYKQQIEFKEFLEIADKLEIRVGLIRSAERIPKSSKLIKLIVSFGDKIGDKVCVTNLGGQEDDLDVFVDCTCPFVMNLKPSKMMGVESEVMIMVGEDDTYGITGYDFEDFVIGSKLL